MQTDPSVKTSHWTDENSLDLVRKLRNDLIKDFLDERYMKEHINSKYGIRELSAVKVEFIKAELKELLISPVNVNHYKRLLDHIKESESAALSEGNEELFFKEIDLILRKYIF